MVEKILFIIFAFFAVVGGLGTITRKNVVHALLMLVFTFLNVAAIFFLTQAYFLAVVQVLVYAGAIMVLFVFVIMLLNAGTESKKGRSLVAQALGAPLLVALLGILAFFVQRLFPREYTTHFGGFTGGTAKDVGMALFTTYLLPFEATSILILIAIVGAIVLAHKEMD